MTHQWNGSLQGPSGAAWAARSGLASSAPILPCTAKADTSRTPTPAMVDFCNANPTSDFIPANVTGRETIYEWRCTDGAPRDRQRAVQARCPGLSVGLLVRDQPRGRFLMGAGRESKMHDTKLAPVGHAV